MVMLNAAQEAELKGKRIADALAITPSDHVGQMWRIQIPIFTDPDLFAAALREHADLLNGLALQMRLAADEAVTRRHAFLANHISYQVRLVNNFAKLPKYGGGRKSDDPGETQ